MRRCVVMLLAVIFTAAALPARADITRRDNYAAIVMDARGQVLAADNADEARFPASLTKMMTLYMLFEAMRDGRVSPQGTITMTAEAASRPPSKLGIPAGMSLSVEHAILAVITRSANDVAAAIAERLGGSEERFAQLMTQRARQMGMTRTTFRNASGLPDAEQQTTARDMATLGRRLIEDFPQHYAMFSATHFRWQNRAIHNHNHMLSAYDGADGIKTGYTRWSGFNIVTSARRDGVRLIGVVMGGPSWSERDRHMAELLDAGFARQGVARRANSYVAENSNRTAARADVQGSVAPRLGPARTAQVPGPRAQQAARAPANRQAAARPAPARQQAAAPTASASRNATPPRSAQRAPTTPPRAAQPQLRPRPVELRRTAPLVNPARPVTRL